MSGTARSVVRLALADILHEWRMSLCLIMAIAAIATPLLLFFGLKYGTIATLQQRLLNNPATLELMPVTERVLDEKWFATWRQDPRVAFVVPHTRRLSAQADVKPANGGAAKRLDLRPSLPGDVLLERYHLENLPESGCVLTSTAAQRLKAEVGQKLTFTVTREQGRAKASHVFTLTGILPAQAGTVAAAYIPLDKLEAVEDYKDGRAVPALGWPGEDPVAHAVARGVLMAFPEKPDLMITAKLQLNTGFARFTEQKEKALLPLLPDGRFVYHMRSLGRGAGKDNFGALREKLRGFDVLCVPLFSDIEMTLPDGKVLKAFPTGGAEKPALLEAMKRLAPAEAWNDFNNHLPPRVMLLPPSALAGQTGPVDMEVTASLPQQPENSISFNVRVLAHPDVPEGMALAPQAMLGQLSLMENRRLRDGVVDGDHPAFLLGRRGYSSFRMYAADMDAVAPLAADLEKEEMRVNTRADRIDEIKRLDAGLSLLFWLIAAASSIGGAACLLSSIYANVERKRKDFAVLRLLGVHGLNLSLFPLVSSLTLTLSGMLLSLGIFHVMAQVIGYLFAAHLEAGESFCYLGLSEQGWAVLAAAGLALVAGVAAALRLASIDPAESLRDE